MNAAISTPTSAASQQAIPQQAPPDPGFMAHTFFSMLKRDALVAWKQLASTLVLLLLQPALILFALGRVQMYIGALPSAFTSILVTGVLGSVIISVSVQSVSAPLIIEFSYTQEIRDRLLAPVPVWLVGIEKIVTGMVKTWICCALYFPLSWLIVGTNLYSVTAGQLVLFFLALFVSSFMMSALGLWIGSITEGSQATIILTVLVMPMSFLGCVYFPWVALAHVPVLQYIVLLDPQTYISELFRGTLSTQIHMSFVWAFCGLLAWSALFLFIGLRAFQRRAVH